MPNPIVTLTRCSDYSEPKISDAIERQFKLLGGLDRFVRPGDSVLLKPNFIAPRSHRHATQTHPAVVLETARLLKDFGARPFIGDSPAWANVFACAKALRLEESLRKLSVPVKQLNKPKWCRIGTKNIRVGISSVALDADVIINLPKFKSHQQLVATFAVKNMFGCVAGKRKALWHFAKGGSADDFCELLIEIFKFLNPGLTLIDAVSVMDGRGPIRGRTRPLGWLIGGTDPIACETICAQLVAMEPANLPIIKTARQMGFGCSDPARIQIAGDDFSQSICTDFELPKLIPIRFSLLHVCKSVCKQIFLLTKATVNRVRF
ncbi:MAG: hypothetical protein AMJ75_12635 [Phycisphaerae bacterium SM1_79]|nr:MAG: hypothetical protein AMJ75_12635 [Phycisphaerae bacterium SM1_79]